MIFYNLILIYARNEMAGSVTQIARCRQLAANEGWIWATMRGKISTADGLCTIQEHGLWNYEIHPEEITFLSDKDSHGRV